MNKNSKWPSGNLQRNFCLEIEWLIVSQASTSKHEKSHRDVEHRGKSTTHLI